MEHPGPRRGPWGPPISRRRLLRELGRGGLGIAALGLLAACRSGGPEERGGSDEPTPEPSPFPPLSGQLSVAQWPLYIDRAKGRKPSLDLFREETGIQVTYREIIADNQAFFAKLIPQLQAGQPTGWDIIALSDWVVSLMRQAGWLVPLDRSRLPTVDAEMGDAFRDPPYDPGNSHSVPWQAGITGIAYNRELVGRELRSFRDLWSEDLAGHVGMLTEMVDTVSLTLLMLGVDPLEATLDDVERAQRELLAQREAGIVRQYYGQDYVQDLLSGNTWATMGWSGDVFYYKHVEGYDDLEFVVPEEGGILWVTPLEIPAGAEHPTDAHAFMDFYYRPEVAAMVTEWVGYISPVPAVRDVILDHAADAEGDDREYLETLAASPLVFPTPEMLATLHSYKAYSEEEKGAYDALFSEVLNA